MIIDKWNHRELNCREKRIFYCSYQLFNFHLVLLKKLSTFDWYSLFDWDVIILTSFTSIGMIIFTIFNIPRPTSMKNFSVNLTSRYSNNASFYCLRMFFLNMSDNPLSFAHFRICWKTSQFRQYCVAILDASLILYQLSWLVFFCFLGA